MDHPREQLPQPLTFKQRPAPFDWPIDPAIVQALYKAAASYVRRIPWSYVQGYAPIVIALGDDGPQPGVDTLYGSALRMGEACWLTLFYAPEGVDRITRAAAQARASVARLQAMDEELQQLEEAALLQQRTGWTDDAVAKRILSLWSDIQREQAVGVETQVAILYGADDALIFRLFDEEGVNPLYLAWLAERGLRYVARRGVPIFERMIVGGGVRLPDERETRAMTLAIAAINRFIHRYRRPLDRFPPIKEELTHVARIKTAAGVKEVTVSYQNRSLRGW